MGKSLLLVFLFGLATAATAGADLAAVATDYVATTESAAEYQVIAPSADKLVEVNTNVYKRVASGCPCGETIGGKLIGYRSTDCVSSCLAKASLPATEATAASLTIQNICQDVKKMPHTQYWADRLQPSPSPLVSTTEQDVTCENRLTDKKQDLVTCLRGCGCTHGSCPFDCGDRPGLHFCSNTTPPIVEAISH